MCATEEISVTPSSESRPATVRRLVVPILIVILMSLMVLGLLEYGLRIGGFGYDPRVAVRATVGDELCWVNNPSFARSYFGARSTHQMFPFALPAKRDDDSLRIMLVGGSAANGDPDPSYGVARQLEVMLRSRFPGAKIEVANAAITAVNSWVVRDIVDQAGDLDIDLWIVLLGNNEVVGPYGAASDSAPQARHPAWVRFRTSLVRWRVVQLIERVTGAFGSAANEDEWTGVESYLERRVAADDRRLEESYVAFRSNLQEIVRVVRARGEEVILCTIPVNLAGCAPFASGHATGLGQDSLTQWEEAFAAGVADQSAGRFAEALTSYQRAAAIDDVHAELMYRMAVCKRAAGQAMAAIGFASRARDMDLLRFRADSRINAIVRDTAKKLGDDRVALVDLSEAFAAASPGGVPGDGLFYDHVHFNFTGAWLAAHQLVEKVLAELPDSLRRHDLASAPLLQEEVAKALAFSEWDRFRVGSELYFRLQRPPFSDQLDNEQDRSAIGRWLQGLQSGLEKDGMARSVDDYRGALNDRPDDWVLHNNLGQLYLDGVGDGARAEAELRLVVERCPNYVFGIANLGAALMVQGEAEEAARLFERARSLRPRSIAVLGNLALTKIMLQEWSAAEELFEQVLELDPDQHVAQLQLAKLLIDRESAQQRARELATKVLEADPENQEARQVLAYLDGKSAGSGADTVDPSTQ